jgi:hypothetical protein
MTNTTPGRPAGAGRTDWRQQAACRCLDPGLFFPVSTSGASPDRDDPVRMRALPGADSVPALDTRRWTGSSAWGGTTEEDRRAMRYAPAAR